MTRISSRAKIATITSLTAFSLSVAAVLGVWFFTEQNKMRLDEIEQTIYRMEREAQQYSTLEQLLTETKDDRATIEKYILTDDHVINFLSVLEQVAVDTGASATTRSISTIEIDGSSTFESLVVDLDIRGSFDAVRTTIDLYEHLPYQTAIESASLGRATDGTDSWNSALRLTATKFKP